MFLFSQKIHNKTQITKSKETQKRKKCKTKQVYIISKIFQGSQGYGPKLYGVLHMLEDSMGFFHRYHDDRGQQNVVFCKFWQNPFVCSQVSWRPGPQT